MRGGRKWPRYNREGEAIATPPVMNGLEPARVLKGLMSNVPLIMYSAFGDRYVEQRASLVGVSSVISKSEPVNNVVGTARSLLTQAAA
jgi:hypothetical protein